MNDEAQLRFGLPAFVTPPASAADTADRISSCAEDIAAGRPAVFVVCDSERPDRLLGTAAWRRDLPEVFRTADVGYSVHADARGHGVAGAALSLLVGWLLSDEGPGMARVQLDHSTENVASCRVALGAGMAKEGVRLGYLPLRDPSAPSGVRRHDVCMHGVLKDPGRRSQTDL